MATPSLSFARVMSKEHTDLYFLVFADQTVRTAYTRDYALHSFQRNVRMLAVFKDGKSILSRGES